MDEGLDEGIAGDLVQDLDNQIDQARALLERQREAREKRDQVKRLRDCVIESVKEENGLKRTRAEILIRRDKKEVEKSSGEDFTYVGCVADVLRERRRERSTANKRRALGDVSNREIPVTLGDALRDQDKLSSLIEHDTGENVFRRKITNRMLGYRLAGVSMFRSQAAKTEDRLVGIRFDTSHRGQYGERFYVLLRSQVDPVDGSEKLEIVRHTLPHFVPTEDLFDSSELRRFSQAIHCYLNAYSARKRDVADTIEHVFKPLCAFHAEKSDSFDTIQIDCEVSKRGGFFADIRFEVTVNYPSLLDSLPNQIVISSRKGKALFDLNEDTNLSLEFSLKDFLKGCINELIVDN